MPMTPNANLGALHAAGVSIWLDTLSRELLQSGEFEALIRDDSVTGATSNPTIFAKAITSSDLYDEQLRHVVSAGQRDPQALFFSLGSTMSWTPRGCCARNTTVAVAATDSSRLSARPTSPTTLRQRSLRPRISGPG